MKWRRGRGGGDMWGKRIECGELGVKMVGKKEEENWLLRNEAAEAAEAGGGGERIKAIGGANGPIGWGEGEGQARRGPNGALIG
jgi:hypothetical protein